MTDPTQKKSQQAMSPYDRLLRGEISSKQYVKSLKQAKTGRYVASKNRRGTAAA